MNGVPATNGGISKRAKKIVFGIIILIICLPLLWILFIFIDFCYITPSKKVHEADEGFKKAKTAVDPEQLRAWALREIPRYPFRTNGIELPQILNSEIPDYMQTLYPEPVEDACVRNENGVTNITIFWGGTFFHWMFEIGPTNYISPKDPEAMTIEWVPGIYYVREDTVHPFQ